MKKSYLAFGPLFITKYVLEAPGEEVKMHTHLPEDPGHITIVMSGKVHAHGPGFSHELSSGTIYDFPDSERTHALTATEPQTVILNVVKQDYTENNVEVILDGLRSSDNYLKAL